MISKNYQNKYFLKKKNLIRCEMKMSIVDQRRPSLKPCSDCWGCSGSCSWHISVLHSWPPKTYTPNTHRTGLPNTDTPRSPEQHPPRSCWEGWPWVFEPRAGRLDGGTACTGTSNQTSGNSLRKRWICRLSIPFSFIANFVLVIDIIAKYFHNVKLLRWRNSLNIRNRSTHQYIFYTFLLNNWI